MRARLLLLFTLVSAVASGAPRPRVALHPIALEGTQDVALPPAAASALLVAAATRALELPSTFEVDDALASLGQPTCAERDACLGALAKLTHAGWAVGVTAKVIDAGTWQLTGRVVDDAGAVTRAAQQVTVAPAAVGFDWSSAAAALLQALQVEGLAVDAELEPLAVAPAPVVTTPAPVVTTPAPVVTSPAPVVTSPATPAAVAPHPAAVAAVPAPPRTGPSLRLPALVVGAVAVGAAGAALSLALVNAGEAEALRAAAQGGVVPISALDRAVRLDERTAVATGLGIGAAVAAGTAAVLWFAGSPAGPRASIAVSPSGAAAVLTGSF